MLIGVCCDGKTERRDERHVGTDAPPLLNVSGSRCTT
jgi:hypothetical protein